MNLTWVSLKKGKQFAEDFLTGSEGSSISSNTKKGKENDLMV